MESAIYSNQGDEYQRLIALHWVVRLLYEDTLDWVQIEAIASPVDDILVGFKDGYKLYIQAKKNQPQHRAWNLSDIRDILIKTGEQLKKDPHGQVYLYSRTPFGDIQRLKESASLYDSFLLFNSNASDKIKSIFDKFKKIIVLPSDEAFKFLNSIEIGHYHDFKDWERVIKEDLKRLFTNHNSVYEFLMGLITQQSARLSTPHRFSKENLLKSLASKGLYIAPAIDETEIIKQFRAASKIGRNYDTKIGGKKILRNEAQTILDFINKGEKRAILVTGRKGSGKTWVLLEAAEQIEQTDSQGLLFIKGDRYDDVYSEDDLIRRLQFKYDPFILASRLSEYRRLIVVIDSLDALSLAMDQKPLKIFLSFIDRLLTLENVTTIIACRDFDLEYDPHLRSRSWDIKIPLSPFDFEKDIKPIFELWNIDVHNINENQKKLFSHPQNLKLYEKIYDKITIASIATEFHIIKLFFDETVEKNKKLGQKAVQSLHAMAKSLLGKRSLFIPKPQFGGDEEMIHILSSEGVLTIDTFRDRVSFAHQSLLDYLMIRSYLVEGKYLLEFILDHPQLPFIRPSIRSFLFYLHSMDNKVFSKEVIRILKDNKVVYHIKRLIVESLSEISSITDVEFNLIKDIYKNFPDLFNRFLWINNSVGWFNIIHPELTSAILSNKENDSTKNALLYSLKKWMNRCPDKAIECWNYVLNTPEPLFEPILRIIDEFTNWEIEGIKTILEKLLILERHKIEDRWIGIAISKYAEAADKGDDLLWQFITQNVPGGTISYNFLHSDEKGLNCSGHHFYRENFLFERFKKSQWLLETAVNSLSDWSSRYEYYNNRDRLNTSFLRDTSWEQRHTNYEYHDVKPITELLNAIHQSLIFHAREKDDFLLNPNNAFQKDTPIEPRLSRHLTKYTYQC